MNQGHLFALLTTLSWAICIFPFTQAARRLGSNALNHFRLFLACIFIGVISLSLGSVRFLEIFSGDYLLAWCWLGISGIVGLTLGDYFAFKMYSILGARIGSVLTTFAPAATLIMGALLIDERISALGIAGIAITVTGVNFVSLGRSERKTLPDHGHGSVAFGIFTGILSALCQGAGLVLAKKGMAAHPAAIQLSPFYATFMRLVTAFIALLLFTLVSGSLPKVFLPLRTNRNNGLKYAVAGTIFGPTLGVSLSLFTVARLNPSVAQTIFSLVPAFALVLSILFFRDKITFKSLAGLVVAVLGVLILIWRDRIVHYF
jgi:drug/metabolite transporter (DMT)-like permease